MQGVRSSAIAKLLILSLTCPAWPGYNGGCILAQEPAAKLTIAIIEGEGAVNNIRLRTAREPIVEVQDENHKPVAGAIVIFRLPSAGPGGTFANGSKLLTVTTDSNGRAAATGMRPNSPKGQYQISVTASFQGLTASNTIHQSSGIGSGGGGAAGGLFGLSLPATLGIVGAVGAGIIVGVIKATGGGKSTRVSVGPPSLP
jgi:hypothetical protein